MPRKGARPGDGLADFVFCAAWKKPMRRIRGRLQNMGLLYHAPPPKAAIRLSKDPEQSAASDVSFADDAAVLIRLPEGREIEAIRQVVRIVHEI